MFSSTKLKKEIEDLKKENKNLKNKNKDLKSRIEELEKEKQKETRKLYDCLYEFKKLKEGNVKKTKKTNLTEQDLKEINRLINKINSKR